LLYSGLREHLLFTLNLRGLVHLNAREYNTTRESSKKFSNAIYKEQPDMSFNELGMNMATAFNIFARQTHP
jgi:hypothetical protein